MKTKAVRIFYNYRGEIRWVGWTHLAIDMLSWMLVFLLFLYILVSNPDTITDNVYGVLWCLFLSFVLNVYSTSYREHQRENRPDR